MDNVCKDNEIFLDNKKKSQMVLVSTNLVMKSNTDPCSSWNASLYSTCMSINILVGSITNS